MKDETKYLLVAAFFLGLCVSLSFAFGYTVGYWRGADHAIEYVRQALLGH